MYQFCRGPMNVFAPNKLKLIKRVTSLSDDFESDNECFGLSG